MFFYFQNVLPITLHENRIYCYLVMITVAKLHLIL